MYKYIYSINVTEISFEFLLMLVMAHNGHTTKSETEHGAAVLVIS